MNVYLFQPQYVVEVSNRSNYWLPYSAGCLWSYAQQFDDITGSFALADIVYRRENPQDILDRMQDPVYAGFSCYVWNRAYCLHLAELIKQRWPNCVIQFGGPDASGKMFEHEFIDSIVMAEGEEAFVETLRAIAVGNEPEQIYSKRRLTNLDIPSPYTTGVFDHIMQNNPDVDWAMTLETNRGCPFSCTFCDWGGVTYSKIKKFNLERVAAELDWAADRNVAYIFCADANFGVFKERDIEIARLIRSAADRGRIESVNLQYAKNSSDTVFAIAKIMGDLSRGVTISMQSMNPDTLKAIKRDNLPSNDIEYLLALGENNNVGSYTEMIIGMPEETLETWKDGIAELFELGQHYSIDIWFAQLLENSELASANSRRQYRISSVLAEDYMPYHSPLDWRGVNETIELINGTDTMSTHDIVEGYLWALVAINFHIGGYSQIYARYLNKNGYCYRGIYDRLFAELMGNNTVLQTHFKGLMHTLYQYLTTGKMPKSFGSGHAFHTVSQKFLYEHRHLVYNFVNQVFMRMTRKSTDVEELQRHFIFDPNTEYPLLVHVPFNVQNRTNAPTTYQIDNPIRNQSGFDFYRARRRGLLKNTLYQIA